MTSDYNRDYSRGQKIRYEILNLQQEQAKINNIKSAFPYLENEKQIILMGLQKLKSLPLENISDL